MTKKVTVTIKKGPDASQEPEKKVQAQVSLDIRRTLDDNIVVYDHEDIDIVIMPTQNKIVAFAKDNYDDYVYLAQDRLFKHLVKKGIIDPTSVQGGSVYMSIQGKMVTTEKYNSVQMAILAIGRFIEEEKPRYLIRKAYEEEEERRLTDPDPEDSTEFDPDKYHRDQKGSLRPQIGPYAGINSVYRL